MRVIFFGSGSFVLPVLKSLEDNFELVGVVTTVDSPVSEYIGTKIPVFTPDKLDNNFVSQLQIVHYELGVVASYGKIIPQDILNIPKYGFLNVHPSLLPKFRGASPVPATILSGEKETGVTIIKMDEKMDHGPIVFTSRIGLSEKENTPELITKLFQAGAKTLVSIIPDYISGKLQPIPQNHEKATFCKMMRKEDGFFEITTPPSAEILDRMIRAYSPWPGVWTRFRPSGSNGQAKIVKFLPSSSHPGLDPGSINIDSRFRGNDRVLLQMEGKKVMSLKDFLNGYPNFPLKSVTT